MPTYDNYTNPNATVCLEDVHGDVDIVAACLYLPFAVWGVVLAVQIFRTRSLAAEGILLMMVTLCCLAGSLVLRTLFFVVECFTNNPTVGWVPAFLGTFALLLFFTAFSVYVFSWARSLDKQHEKLIRNIVLYGNIALYGVVLVLSITFAVLSGDDFMLDNQYGDVINVIVGVCDLGLSVAFASYGACALKLMRQIRARTRTKEGSRLSWRMWVAICVCSGCFLMKTVLITIRVANVYSPATFSVVYPWLDFVVPELAPAVMILFLFHQTAKWRRKRRVEGDLLQGNDIISQFSSSDMHSSVDSTGNSYASSRASSVAYSTNSVN